MRLSFRDRSNFDMKVPLTWTAGVAVIIAAVIGVALLLGDRRETFQVQVTGAGSSVLTRIARNRPSPRILRCPVKRRQALRGRNLTKG